MQYPGLTAQLRRANWAFDDSIDRRYDREGVEDIHLRNHDLREGYDIELTFDGPSRTINRRYYLQPGRAESYRDVVPTGTYEVRATLDNQPVSTRRCRIGDDPARTVLIEVGNGVLTLTEGFDA